MRHFMENFIYPALSPTIAFMGQPHSGALIAGVGFGSFIIMAALCALGAFKINGRAR